MLLLLLAALLLLTALLLLAALLLLLLAAVGLAGLVAATNVTGSHFIFKCGDFNRRPGRGKS